MYISYVIESKDIFLDEQVMQFHIFGHKEWINKNSLF